MKRFVQNFIRDVHVRAFARGLPDRLGIYMHSIESDEQEMLRRFAEVFLGLGYRFVGAQEFLQGSGGKRVYLSFDDNYRSWYAALGLLDSLSIRAAFYVNSGVLRDRAGQAELSAYFSRVGHQGERVALSTSELKELAAAGHGIGSHTATHRMLTRLRADDAHEEIRRGKEELEEILGAPVVHFSYPFGMRRHFSERLRGYCRSIGIQTIAHAIPGMQHAGHSALRIQRSPWRLDLPVAWNLENVRVDGRIFEALTGRSAVGG